MRNAEATVFFRLEKMLACISLCHGLQSAAPLWLDRMCVSTDRSPSGPQKNLSKFAGCGVAGPVRHRRRTITVRLLVGHLRLAAELFDKADPSSTIYGVFSQ